MEFNYYPSRGAADLRNFKTKSVNTANGLSSPQQLVEVTASLAISLDQTAAGASLVIIQPESLRPTDIVVDHLSFDMLTNEAFCSRIERGILELEQGNFKEYKKVKR
jgi:hypothetical protein